MDYIRLIDISNKYPTLPNYVRQSDKLVNLFGLYKETNKLEFPLPTIDYITPIDDLKLRTIIGFRKNNQDTNIKYYTSQQLYSDMEASNIEGNPYFLTQTNNSDFIILVDLEKFISVFEGLKEIENKQGIDMLQNNFLNKDGSIDYTKCMQYLDWVLSKPELDEIDTDGVIPAQKLSKWDVGEYDPILMKWSFTAETKEKLESKLKNINSDIKIYENYIAQAQYPTSRIIGPIVRIKFTVDNSDSQITYTSAPFTNGTAKAIELTNDIRKQLKDYLDQLISQKTSIEAKLVKLK
jgi:hypothetical protein